VAPRRSNSTLESKNLKSKKDDADVIVIRLSMIPEKVCPGLDPGRNPVFGRTQAKS